VLDIGAWDGWFSFEMERRGAEVLAIDNWDNPRFHEARRLLNSRVEYRQMDVFDLTPAVAASRLRSRYIDCPVCQAEQRPK